MAHAEVFKELDGSARVSVRFGPVEMAHLEQSIVRQTVEIAAQTLAADFIKAKGAEIVASIPLDTVLRLAVAKTVVKIGAAASEENGR